jgi:flap endonuclease-1
MGIKSLSTILNQYCKCGIKNVTLETFRGKVLAIDTSIFLYKFTYNTSDYLEGFTRQILRLLRNGITPLYVFDGKPPEEKKEILNDRKYKRNLLVKKKKLIESILENKEFDGTGMEKYLEDLKGKSFETLKDEITKIKRKIIYITGDDINRTKKLFELFGVPYLEADGEAETFCSVLSRKGYITGCITEDTDYLASGGDNFIRGFNSNNNNIVLCRLNEILSELGVTYEQFLDICILCGCDYTTKITGIGAIKAYKFIKKYNNIETIIEKLSSNTSYKVQDNFNFHKARELLKCENTFDLSNIDKNNFKLRNVNEELLIDYLKKNSEILKTKYYNEIALKLCKYRANINIDENTKVKKQKRIGDFFERKKYFITEEI